MGRRGRDPVQSGPTPLGGLHTNGMIITVAEVLPKELVV